MVQKELEEKGLTGPDTVKTSPASESKLAPPEKTEDDWDKLDVLRNDFARIIS